jgi:hypothetical protein
MALLALFSIGPELPGAVQEVLAPVQVLVSFDTVLGLFWHWLTLSRSSRRVRGRRTWPRHWVYKTSTFGTESTKQALFWSAAGHGQGTDSPSRAHRYQEFLAPVQTFALWLFGSRFMLQVVLTCIILLIWHVSSSSYDMYPPPHMTCILLFIWHVWLFGSRFMLQVVLALACGAHVIEAAYAFYIGACFSFLFGAVFPFLLGECLFWDFLPAHLIMFLGTRIHFCFYFSGIRKIHSHEIARAPSLPLSLSVMSIHTHTHTHTHTHPNCTHDGILSEFITIIFVVMFRMVLFCSLIGLFCS